MTGASPNSVDLLSRLASGVRPVGSGATTQGAGGSLENSSFADLLRLAREGGVEASRPLKIGREVAGSFGEDTLSALALAADAAEAAGATRLKAVVEGRTVTIDVLSREIVSSDEVAPGGLITDADAFIVIPGETAGRPREDRAGALGFPSSMPSNPTLAETLARVAGSIAKRVG